MTTFIDHVDKIAAEDAAGLHQANKHYGDSWKRRGGVGAFMMLARKWDRIERRLEKDDAHARLYDIFAHLAADERVDGLIDDIRDLRRYLILVEAEARAQGIPSARTTHQDNLASEGGPA